MVQTEIARDRATLIGIRIGFFLLIGVSTLLMLHVQAHALQKGFVWTLAVFGVMLAMLLQALREWRQIRGSQPIQQNRPAFIPVLCAMSAGSFVTVFLAHYAGLGTVAASSITGILAAWLFPSLATIAYCGSFVGMLSLESFPYLYQWVISSVIAAVTYHLGATVFNGFGGKLGATAFVGCVLTAWLTHAPLAEGTLPERYLGLMILGVSVFSALAAYVLNIRFRTGPVMGSALVGLAAGILLPRLPLGSTGPLLAVVAFCASFAGMASRERLQTEWHILLAGVITGIVFVFSSPSLGGAGGKLGAIAFVATLSTRAIVTSAVLSHRLLLQALNKIRRPLPG